MKRMTSTTSDHSPERLDQVGISVALFYMQSEMLILEDFTLEVSDRDVEQQKVSVHLSWKKRPPHLRGSDTHSRMLVIDGVVGKVEKVVWPR